MRFFVIKKFNCDFKMNQRKKSYSSKYKLEIVEFSDKHGNRAAAREYQTDEENIRRWRQEKIF